MSYFLNTVDKDNQFINLTKDNYFVDKTELIGKLNEQIETYYRFICIAKPRYFGKSVNAAMLASYYAKNLDTKDIFDKLNVSKCDSYEEHLNKHNVIYMSLNASNFYFEDYRDYYNYFVDKLTADIQEFCPDVKPDDYLSDMLRTAYEKTGQGFIFIIDECDYVYTEKLFKPDDVKSFYEFLSGLLIHRPYVEFAYITGLLPVSNWVGDMDMFMQFDILNDTKYGSYFGFTQSEVETLCSKQDKISIEDLKEWYNGYYTHDNISLYNPHSVVYALTNGYCANYWTGTAPIKVILNFIKDNTDNIQEDIIKLVRGESIGIKLRGYQKEEDGDEPDDRNSILSALAIYGNLSYHDNTISIPNKEVRMLFENTLLSKSLTNINKITSVWRDMLYATLNQDTDTMSKIIEEAHDTYIPLMKYNNEDSLATVILLVYLGASESYQIEREMRGGKGYADFVFIPDNKNDTAFLLELKVNSTPKKAIEQIKKTKYMKAIRNCKGKKLAVGIAYNKKDKKHSVEIEEIK